MKETQKLNHLKDLLNWIEWLQKKLKNPDF